MIEGRGLPGTIRADRVEFFHNASDALEAVNRGEIDFVYGLASYMEYEIQKNHFTNVVPVTLVNDRMDVSFALAKPADPELLTIINKAVNSISSDRRNELMDQNLISVGSGQLSLTELIYANPFMFIGVLTTLLLILVTSVLWFNRMRVKSAVMQSSLEKAEAENRAKGAFLSRMSHELRTPMNAVVGLAELAGMTEGVPENVREMLVKLRASSHYLLDLINDILDMSRLDSGMLETASEPFSLEELLGELRTMMETEAGKRGLICEMEADVDHSRVTGDSIRLRQVLMNLLSNAFKFTPEGGTVTLRVTEKTGVNGSADFDFRVTDTGVGIAPEDQERIFDTFEQMGTNYSRSQGTGLGLPISRSIVQLMGGELRVKSEPGHGSEFYFTLTLPLDSLSEECEDGNPMVTDDNLLEGVRILLAEDNDLNAEIAIQLLELKGAQVSRSENGRLAAERFAASAPGEFQAILMDIQMPEMNGLEAARAIRAMDRPDAAVIPIVAMTANVFKEDVDAAMEAGMNGFEGKPLDVEHLYRQLCRLLGIDTE